MPNDKQKQPHEMTVAEIVEAHLKENGFDGLASETDNPDCCGCDAVCVFSECNGERTEDCVPAFKFHDQEDGDLWVNAPTRAEAEKAFE